MNNPTLESYLLSYLMENTSTRKKVTSEVLFKYLKSNKLISAKWKNDGSIIRGLVHKVRLEHPIYKNDQIGWVCGGQNGYWVSYSPFEIKDHLDSFFAKIGKMMKVYMKGQEVLNSKVFMQQGKLL